MKLFLGVVAYLVIMVLVVRWLNRKPWVIHIPRMPVDGEGNAAGQSILADCCPVCGQGGFYNGPQNRDGSMEIYCGNSDCRTGFRVFNYGGGKIKADPLVDKGPDHLYR